MKSNANMKSSMEVFHHLGTQFLANDFFKIFNEIHRFGCYNAILLKDF